MIVLGLLYAVWASCPGWTGASSGSRAEGLGFLAPPPPSPGALRGTSLGAPGSVSAAASAWASASLGAAGAGAAAFAFAAGASRLSTALQQRSRATVTLCRAKKKLEELQAGEVYDGKITRVAPIGIWVDIGAEKEALWPKMKLPPGRDFKPGEFLTRLEIEEVLTGDTPAQRKIRVIQKPSGAPTEPQETPSEVSAKNISDLKVGMVLDAKVTQLMNFGVFCDIGIGRSALIPTPQVGKELSVYKKDLMIKVKIEKIDGTKVTLTDRVQADEPAVPTTSPGADTEKMKQLKVGDLVEGTVTGTNTRVGGVFIDIGLGKEVLCRTNQLDKPLSAFKVGDKVTGMRIARISLAQNQVELTTRRLGSELKMGDVLEGTVQNVMTDKMRGIFFDAGYFGDAFCPEDELSKEITSYTKGEVADLVVTQVRQGQDATTLVTVSTKVEAFSARTPLGDITRGMSVTGTVQRVSNSGVLIDIGTVKSALLPRKLWRGSFEKGQEVKDLIIMNVDPQAEYVEVSLPGAGEEKEDSLQNFPAGMAVEGKVTRSQEFGVFINIGASRDAVWMASQLPKPYTEYKVGDTVTGLKIVESDPERNRLTVSDRPGPANFEEGQSVTGTVTNTRAFGVFVDIGATTDALLPARYLAKNISEYKQGMQLDDIAIMNLDIEGNKISIGQKGSKGMQTPTVKAEDLKVGQEIKGIVRRPVDFGVFVDIGLGRRDALLPARLMKDDFNPGMFKEGDAVEGFIQNLDIKPEGPRVTMSMKPIEEEGFAMDEPDWMPPDQMMPNRKYAALYFGEDNLDEDSNETMKTWKEWEKKYPGLVRWYKDLEVELLPDGDDYKGYWNIVPADKHYLPVPLHLRRPDAGPPVIPKERFSTFGHDQGLPYEIHTKYRKPPMNDPNWVNRMKYATVTEDGD